MDYQEYVTKRKSATEEAAKQALFQQAKQLENEDRRCFSQARDGWEVAGREDLSIHPHKSLVPLFRESDGSCNVDAFTVDAPTADDANRNKRVFALNRKEREELGGNLAVVPTLAEFKSTFQDVFCEGLLRYMNWNNVFAAGGGVLACAVPVPPEYALNHSTKRKYFHDLQYSASDVDLFLYGLNEEQAKDKLREIYRAVCESCPHTVVCFRSAHAVTLVSEYPFRHIQIVLRLYSSPYEVLAGFDVDACTVGFDGNMVYADVRAHHALVTRRNTIDVTRRSPSYEMRLAKYGVRGFEVEVNDLDRDMVDPGIFERPWNSLEGLAKLLVLEKLRTPEQRTQFFEMQKLNREGGAAQPQYNWRVHGRYQNSPNTQERLEEKLGGTAEVSNYSTVFLPWGPEHSANSIMRLMATKDKKLNSPWFMKSRPYRLHPCFFGTADEIMQDCSKSDPPFPPKKDDENAKMREHRETYVRGPLAFIMDDPGRQRIGSFHPLSEHGWAEGVYFNATTEELFAAVVADDADRINKALEKVSSANVRDFFGRTALHLAVMAGSTTAVRVLLQAGASPLEPMAGGRTVFHLAAMYGRTTMISELRDAAEAVFMKKENPEGQDESELVKKARSNTKQLVRVRDGDAQLSPFQMSLLFGRLDCARQLLKAGAVLVSDLNPKKQGIDDLITLLPDDQLEEGIKLLVEHGYSCATLGEGKDDTDLFKLVLQRDLRAVEILSRVDPSFIKAANMASPQTMSYPIRAAVENADVEMVRLLLKANATCVLTEAMIFEAKKSGKVLNYYQIALQSPGFAAMFFAIQNLAAMIVTLLPNPLVVYHTYQGTMKARTLVVDTVNHKDPDLVNEGYSLQAAENVKNCMEIVQLLLPKTDLDIGSRSVFQIHQLINFSDDQGLHRMVISSDYWKERDPEGAAANPYQFYPPVTCREYAAACLGMLDALMQETETAETIPKATFTQLCRDLEPLLIGRAKMELEAWRLDTERSNPSAEENMFEHLEPELKKKLQALSKENMELAKQMVQTLASTLNVPEDIRKSNSRVPQMAARRQPRRMALAVSSSANDGPFPSCQSLFADEIDPSETQIRKFLEDDEARNPVPVPFPVAQSKKEPQEPWILAGLRRSLFRLVSRSFMSLGDAQSLHAYRYGPLAAEHHREQVQPGVLGLPSEKQSKCALVFGKCERGEVNDLDDVCRRLDVSITTTDKEGLTPLMFGIIQSNVDLIKRVIAIAKSQLKKPKAKKKDKPNERIDNFELMAEMEEEDDYDDEDEEDEEEEEEEDGDEEHEEGEDDGDEDDEDGEDDEDEEGEGDDDEDEEGEGDEEEEVLKVAKPKKEAKMATKKETEGGQSMIKPEKLFLLTCSLPLDPNRFPAFAPTIIKQLDEFIDHVGSAVGNEAIEPLTGRNVRVTPIQLAILQGNPAVVETLLEEARNISPSLVRSILNHNFASMDRTLGNNAFYLALSLDRVECLQVMISRGGYAMELEVLATKFQVLNWKFRAEEVEKVDEDVEDLESANRRKLKSERYEGLGSTLYGAGKRAQELAQNPRLHRLTRLPLPDPTLLHLAAQRGARKCYQYLTDQQALIESAKSFLTQSEGKAIRELFAEIRQMAPKAFQLKFGSEVTVECDAKVFVYAFLGGDEMQPDNCNRLPIHYAVLSGTLLGLDGLWSKDRLVKKWSSGKVSEEDLIRFKPSLATSLGNVYVGGSPLSLACWVGASPSVVNYLVEMGFDPCTPDEYFYSGMTAFHVALMNQQWETAKVIAKHMSAKDLLRPTSRGITPLMTAVRFGSLKALLAAFSVCEEPVSVESQADQVDLDGVTALQIASTGRFSECVRLIMAWLDKKNWLREDFLSGRTPLDTALGSTLSHAVLTHSGRTTRHGIVQVKMMEERYRNVREVASDGHQIVQALSSSASQLPRVRALFPVVRRAREENLDRIAKLATTQLEQDREQAKGDLLEAWGENVHLSSLEQFAWSNETDPQKDGVTAMDMVIGKPYEDGIRSVWI